MSLGVFEAPDLVEGAVFTSEIKEPGICVTCRSNAYETIFGNLRRAHNANAETLLLIFLLQALMALFWSQILPGIWFQVKYEGHQLNLMSYKHRGTTVKT